MECSIVIPTYNRKKFSKLISLNIIKQTFPFIKEVIVADDGDDDERLVLNISYSVLYYKVPRMSIGEKRNFLASKASGDFICHMDTDDIYSPEYLSRSIFNLIRNGKHISGSADMNMYNVVTKKSYNQKCIFLHMLNEATMVYRKSYADTHKFSNSMSSEGIGFLTNSLNDIYETSIDDIMICLCHDTNTVSKLQWCNPKYETLIDMTKYADYLISLDSV